MLEIQSHWKVVAIESDYLSSLKRKGRKPPIQTVVVKAFTGQYDDLLIRNTSYQNIPGQLLAIPTIMTGFSLQKLYWTKNNTKPIIIHEGQIEREFDARQLLTAIVPSRPRLPIYPQSIVEDMCSFISERTLGLRRESTAVEIVGSMLLEGAIAYGNTHIVSAYGFTFKSPFLGYKETNLNETVLSTNDPNVINTWLPEYSTPAND